MEHTKTLYKQVRMYQALLSMKPEPSPELLRRAKAIADECAETNEWSIATGTLWESLLGEKYWEKPEYKDSDDYMEWIERRVSEKNPFVETYTFKGIHIGNMKLVASANGLRYVFTSNESLN